MTTKTAKISRLQVQEDMTIYHAMAQKLQLLDALAAAEHLELDLHAVDEMDTTGLQLLLLLKREAVQHGKSLSVLGHSARVQEVIDFCNLAGVFGDPMVISAKSSPESKSSQPN